MGHGLARILIVRNRNLGPIAGRTGQRRIDGAAGALGHTPADGEVGALQAAIATVRGELLSEALMRRIGLRHDQQPRRILVEPMDDPRPADPANARKAVATMCDERVDQSTGGMSRRRVHHESRRLVDHDQIIVLVRDGKRQRFGLRRRGNGGWQLELDRLARFDPLVGVA